MDAEFKGCQWNFLWNSLCLYLQVLAESTIVYIFLFRPFEVGSGENGTEKGIKHMCLHTVINFKHFQTFYQLVKDLRT